MRLQRLKVEQLRQFRAPFEVDGIAPGLNLFVGPNEAGKSTLVRAIRAAFFERHRSSTVEDLRPWGEPSAAPAIELDFTVGDVAYRLRKSFLQRKRCELKSGSRAFDGEDAEQHLAALLGFTFAGKGASRPELWGIPGLLWIEQGQAHELQSSVRNATDHLRKALEASVGEVASTQGDALIMKVRAERDLLLTPSTDKPKGELKRAIDDQEALQAQLVDLDARIEGYRRQVDQLAALKAEHAAALAERPWEALRARQQEAEQALSASDALVRELEAEVSSLGRVEQRLALVEQQLAGFEEARRALARREAGVSEAEQRLEAAVAIEDRRVDEHAKAQAACVVTAADLERARQGDLHRELALRAADADARVRELDALLQRAAEAQSRIEQLHQRVAATVIEATDVERLRELATALEAVQLRRDVAATRIRFELADRAAATLDGEPLDGSGERLITTPATIDVPGVGRFEVVPGGDALGTLARDEADTRAAFEALLRRCGVADLAQAQARMAEHRQATQDGLQAATTLASLAPRGVEALKADRAAQTVRGDDARARVAMLGGEAGGQDEPLPLPEAEARHLAARTQADTIGAQLAETRQARLVAREQHEAALREREAARARLDAPERQAQEAQAGRQLLAARAEGDALRASIAARREAVEGTQRALLEQSVERYRRSADVALQGHRERESQITRLGGSLEEAGAQGLEETRAAQAVRLQATVRRRRELDLRARALDLLLERLEARRRELTRRLRAPLQSRIDHYMRLLFPKAALEIGDDLLPGLLTRPAGPGDETGAVAELSHGAREQMGVLVRLAYADLLKDAGRPTLLILDDALVHSDLQRLERMKRVLFDAAQRHQVLLFTCHPSAWQDMGVAPRTIARG
jgi:chromosome segregation ATPase